MSVKPFRRVQEVQYFLEFGDSQNPERYQFTELEMKALHRDLGLLLYDDVKQPPPGPGQEALYRSIAERDKLVRALQEISNARNWAVDMRAADQVLRLANMAQKALDK